jgi:hypothetical protein
MAFPLWRLFMSGRASRLRTAYRRRVSPSRRSRQAHEDAEHICAQTMENIMPLRTIRDLKAADRHLRCGAPALFA